MRTGDDTRGMVRRGIRLRLLCLAVASFVVAASALTSNATTANRIDRAKAELRDLSEQVMAQEAGVEAARARAATATTQAIEAQQDLVTLLQQRADLASRVAATQNELATAQGDLNAAAVEAFINSPGTVPGADAFAALLGAQSLAQVQDRLAYGEAVAQAQQRTIERVTTLTARLQAQADAQDAVIAAAEDLQDRREAAVRDREAAWLQEQQALTALDAARDHVVALLDRLRDRLAPADVAAVAQAFQGSSNITYGEWARAFLDVMGAPRCHENLVVTIAWQAQEGTQAAWNPLATTHRMDGSTDFNSVGVQNYRSLAQGLQASKETIDNGWDVYGYGPVIERMRQCARAMTTARAIADSRWCSGCASGRYVLGIVPAVEASFETYAAL